MIRREGNRMLLSGPVTFANIKSVLEEGLRQVNDGIRTVDFAEVSELDSSLLAAMLAWLRAARSEKSDLVFANLPEDLVTLARVYGVEPLLPAAPAAH